MAKVLFFLQLIVALVVLPLWPGLDGRYTVWGMAFLGVVLSVPLATVTAVYGLPATVRALSQVWSPIPLGPGFHSVVEAWALAAKTFPLAGVLGGTVAVIGPLQNLVSDRPLAPQVLTLAFFALIWGFLGLLMGRILHEVSRQLTRPGEKRLLVLTDAFTQRFGLTPRETEVAQAVLDGDTYESAGVKLSIRGATVKSHILSVYQKTGVGNKIELLRLVEAENARLHHSVDGRPDLAGRS